MKTALFSALLVLSSVITLGLTESQQEASNSIDQIRSEEMVAPGGKHTTPPIMEKEEDFDEV